MMKHIFDNRWCRLLAGNLSLALLVVCIPMTVLLTITQSLAAMTAGLVILGLVHVALLGLQISRQGTWIPENWLAVGFVFLPVIDVSQTVSRFNKGLWLAGFWAFLMAVAAAFVTVHIVKNQWQKWRHPKTATMTRTHSSRGDQTINPPMDDTTMVY